MSAENPRGHFPELPEGEARPIGPGPVDLVPPRGGGGIRDDEDDFVDDGQDDSGPPRRLAWERNLLLFLATVPSVILAGSHFTTTGRFRDGIPFAIALLSILVCHELGHYVAARLHRVRASLPFFLPVPYLSPFGTMGAVILMSDRIRSRRALLDIGAAGPLAGLVVAVPIMIFGLMHSPIIERATTGYVQEGQSLLYWLLKRAVVGPIGATQDIATHPIALAAWAGFFVTFLNLIPYGQLDGGHVAYALLGRLQDRVARWSRFFPILLAVIALAYFGGPPALLWLRDRPLPPNAWLPSAASINWAMLFLLLTAMRRISGDEHPPVDDHELGVGRRIVGWITLGFFVLLFMPFPWVAY